MLLVLGKHVGGHLTQPVLERRRKSGNISFSLFESDSLAGSSKNTCMKEGNTVVS